MAWQDPWQSAGQVNDSSGNSVSAIPAPASAAADPWESLAPAQAATPVAAPAPQQSGWMRYINGAGSNLLSGLDQGLGAVGDLREAALGLAKKYLPTAAYNAVSGLSSAEQALSPVPYAPTSSELTSDTDKLGLTNRPDLQPQNEGEKLGAAALRGVGAALPAVATGDIPAVLASGAIGGTSAEAAHEALPDSQLAPIVAGLIGGGVTGIGAGIVGKAIDAHEAANAVTQSGAQLAQAESQLADAKNGIASLTLGEGPEQLAAAKAAVDQAQAAKTQAIADAKQTSIAARDAAITQAQTSSTQKQNASQQALEAVAGLHSPAKTLQEAGENIQQSTRDWLTNTMPAKQEQAWDAVAVDPKAPVSLDAFGSALGKINTSAGALEPLAAEMKPGLPQRLQSLLSNVNAPVTWQDARALRTTLGDAMGNPQVIRDVGQKNLSHLYGALTSDLSDTAAASGQALNFSAANAESSRLYDLARGPVSKIIAGPKATLENDPDPGTVAKKLLSGGQNSNRDLAALSTEIPDIGKHLTAAQLREDPQGWNKLSPQAQQTLMPDPGHRQITDYALALAQKAPADEKLAIAQAKAAHAEHMAKVQENAASPVLGAQANLKALQQAQDSARLAARRAQIQAQQSVASASKAHAASTARQASLSAPKNGLSTLVGEQVGEQLGHLSNRLTGGVLGGPIGGILGATVPRAVKLVGHAIANPLGVGLPALLGGNAAEAVLRRRQGQ